MIGETVPERSAGRGTNRGHRVGQEIIDAIKQAIVDDWRELGRIVSRSRFVLKAVAASAEAPRAAPPTAATTTAAAGPPATPADPAALPAVLAVLEILGPKLIARTRCLPLGERTSPGASATK